jgi:succinate dehydrogenase hydrophobic anchor subunit
MNAHTLVGYLVWGFLAYGLTRAVQEIAAWMGTRVTGIAEGVLYVVMLFVAAYLLLYLFDKSEESG